MADIDPDTALGKHARDTEEVDDDDDDIGPMPMPQDSTAVKKKRKGACAVDGPH
jgi:hypothetical protein